MHPSYRRAPVGADRPRSAMAKTLARSGASGGKRPRHEHVRKRQTSGGRAAANGRLSPARACGLANRHVDPVEQIGRGDPQHERGELPLVVVLGDLVPDLVGHGVRLGRSTGSSPRRAPSAARSPSSNHGASRQAETAKSRSSVSPAFLAPSAPDTTQNPHPLIWLARRWTSPIVSSGTPTDCTTFTSSWIALVA